MQKPTSLQCSECKKITYRQYFCVSAGVCRQCRTGEKKRNAGKMVNRAVKDGVLPPVKTRQCQDCKKRMAQHYHHEDYDKPLEVIPLCVSCHHVRHGKKSHADEPKKKRKLRSVARMERMIKAGNWYSQFE